MARGDRDADYKADALRFCVSSGMIPYLEVQVASAVDLTEDEKVLTDIDVLGLMLGADGSVRRVLFDCKSSKTPPMSRAFWLAGLMAYVHADEGFIILGRAAEKAHRLSAQTMDVRLFDKSSFTVYGTATEPGFQLLLSYAADMQAWYRLRAGVSAAGSRHASLWRHLSSEVPLGQDPAKRFRRLLASVREHRGELDPAKPLHLALFTEIVLASTLLLVEMMGELRNVVELNDNYEEFASVLRFYIWGGREGYAILRRMNEISGRDDLTEFENNVLAWPQFVQLARGLLEAPTAIRICCLPLRELVLRFVTDALPASDARLGGLFALPRARQFVNRIAAYIATASKLPLDFPKEIGKRIDNLIPSATGGLPPAQVSSRT